MSYFHVVQLAKTVGFKDSDTLFNAILVHSLQATIDKLTDDTCVLEQITLPQFFITLVVQNPESTQPAVMEGSYYCWFRNTAYDWGPRVLVQGSTWQCQLSQHCRFNL